MKRITANSAQRRAVDACSVKYESALDEAFAKIIAAADSGLFTCHVGFALDEGERQYIAHALARVKFVVSEDYNRELLVSWVVERQE